MRRASKTSMKGRLAWNPRGYAFVDVDGMDTGVYVPRSGLGGALPGDLVEVQAWPGRLGLRGRVTSVVERESIVVTGRYTSRVGFGVLEPHQAFPYTIIIPEGAHGSARSGDTVSALVDPPRRPGRVDAVTARVLKPIRFPEGIGEDLRLVSSKYALSWAFPREVEREAREVSLIDMGRELSRRRDLRERILFTIDPPDARDHDDALGIEEMGDGTLLLTVAIADVAHVVKRGGALDREARKRGFSVCFPGACIPMLPEVLSSDAMSLSPGQDRLAVCVELVFAENAEPVSCRIFEAVVRSRARLSYDEVGPFLEGARGGDERFGQEVASRLTALDRICRRIREKRLALGGLDLEIADIAVGLAPSGCVSTLERASQNAAHRLVEEAMLLANRAVCRFLTEKKRHALFRVHEQPGRKDLMDLAEVLAEIPGMLGPANLVMRGASSGSRVREALQAALDAARSTPLESFVARQVVKALKRARYSPDDIGHFGLAFDGYLHFTSPIRRYPDLVVHRILKGVLRGEGGRPERTDRKTLERLAQEMSMREELTDNAMREALRLKAASFMAQRMGEDFDAVVTALRPGGLFVEVLDIPVEGVVRGDSFDGGGRAVRRRRARPGLGVGDVARVRLVRADTTSGQLDFVLVPPEGRDAAEAGIDARPRRSARGRPGRGRKDR